MSRRRREWTNADWWKSVFWEKVGVAGEDECWLWLASVFKDDGYGQFQLGARPHGAHRVAWFLMNGEIPDGMQVLHKCDNPPCCNPNHLFLGTPLANMQDKNAKGRGVYLKGGDTYNARLRADDVRDMRERRKQGEQLKSIAERHGVSFQHVSDIVHRRRWAHVA